MRLIIGTLTALALSAPIAATAADLPVKARPVAVVANNWTGWYVGGNAGYSWGRATTDQTDTSSDVSVVRAFRIDTGAEVTAVPGFAGITFPVTTIGTPVTGSTSNKTNVNGFIGGLQTGYNWQVDKNWLLGLEADFQGSAERGSSTSCAVAGCGLGTAIGSAEYRLRWFGTARGRVGFLPTDWLVLYATGGLAYGRIDASYTSGINLAAIPLLAGSVSTTRVGWTVGAGAEAAINRNWSWKVEYLYMDLGNFGANLGSATGSVTGAPLTVGDGRFIIQQTVTTTGSAQVSSRFVDHILRVGINYRFDAGPVVARY